MNISEFAETIEFNIVHNIKHSILGLGAPGIGKSELIQQIGQKYGYKVIDLRLAQMSEVEISGLIFPNEDKTKTIWLSPDILPDEKRDGNKTILLLDEITSCSKKVQVAAYQLILDRRIGQYKLPEGTFVIALGNREDDDGVYIHLAGPLADRFEIHYIEPDFETWKYTYALNNGVHPLVISYLTFKPAALHTHDPESDAMTFATPRSWVRVSDILHFDDDITKNVVRNKIAGNIGEIEARQFFEFCKKKEKYVTLDQVLAGRKQLPVEMDEVSVFISSIASRLNFLANVESEEELTDEQKRIVGSTIEIIFDFKNSEYTVMGLRELIGLNRRVAKQIFLNTDNSNIFQFINSNEYLYN
ncbi:MAG: MoxR family ATPase [Lachnospiraceae bacterium]|nr:MoxR family ATPase [Lachnospiraceae bacterium]